MLRHLLTFALAALCSPLAAQHAAASDSAAAEPEARWIVRFGTRSFDLEGFRSAVRQRVAPGALAALVRDLETAAHRDQEAFARQLRQSGGRVEQRWWLINGCSIEAPPRLAVRIRGWDNVVAVEPDRTRRAHLDVATDSQHHGSDRANMLRGRSGGLVRGGGVTLAVLDSGADADANGSMRPHRSFYPGGDITNKTGGGIAGSLLRGALHIPQFSDGEDRSGHGSGVIGCATANRWSLAAGVDDGIAPDAGLLSVRIADASNVTKDSWMITGWQMAATQRLQDNVAVGNCSYGGSPDLNSSLQLALDAVARAADILVCVSAGNDRNNTSESQSAYNGIAVGAVDKVTLNRSSFSAIGPLHGTARTYPDLVAVGSQLQTVRPDDETGTANQTGTSLASPIVAGIAALLRQADTSLSALETKALLLNSAIAKGSRNEYGVGFVRADTAVVAAVSRDVSRATLLGHHKVARFPFHPVAGLAAVTVTWMRKPTGAIPDVDVRVLNDQNIEIGRDGNPANSYEQVRFAAAANTTYTVEVTWNNPGSALDELEFALAGAQNRDRPTLSILTPNATPAYQPGLIQLQGHALAAATSVQIAGHAVPFEILDESSIRIHPSNTLPIGPAPVQVVTRFGVSNAIVLHLTPPTSPLLLGDGSVLRGRDYDYRILADKNWTSLLTVSLSDRPSLLPGWIKLGIGNNFAELVVLRYLPLDHRGQGSIRWQVPLSLPGSTKFFLQALTTDLTNPTYPYPVTNVLAVKVY